MIIPRSLLILGLALLGLSASAFVPPVCTSSRTCATLKVVSRRTPAFLHQKSIALRSTSSDSGDATSITQEEDPFTEDELRTVQNIWEAKDRGDEKLGEIVAKAMPTMHPNLIIKLRQVEANIITGCSEEVVAVAKAVAGVLTARMEEAKQLLTDLLDCGEIRKLDAAIGAASRQGQLDMAFFTVLDMNLQDAVQKQSMSDEGEDGKEANRAQILQHIYTRCQEEVEKTVPPGVALLNKLLRTEQDSIRRNQLEHFLCPKKNVIKSPDGKEIQLEGTADALVPPSELVAALAGAIKQIRTVENAGGVNPAAAASVVESCRVVAKEARVVIGNNYGTDSDELRNFEEDLEPVFRPTTPDSVYIKGE